MKLPKAKSSLAKLGLNLNIKLGNKGETLIESVISMLLFTILLLALVATINTSISTNQRVIENSKATQAAVDVLRTQTYATAIGATTSSITFTYNGQSFSSTVILNKPEETQGLVGFKLKE